MAEGKGITWGGVIKGVAKISAVVAVSVGIAMGAAWGIDSLFTGSENEFLAKAGGAGAAVAAGITNVTTDVVNAGADALSWVGDLFTSNENTFSGEDKAKSLAANYEAPDASTDGVDPLNPDALPEGLDDKMKAAIDAFTLDPDGDALSLLATMEGDIAKVIELYEAAGLDIPEHLTVLQGKMAELPALIQAVNDASTGTELTEAYDALADKLHEIDGQRNLVEASNDLLEQEIHNQGPVTDANKDQVTALQNVIDGNNVLLAGDSFNGVVNNTADLGNIISAELKIQDPGIELKHVPAAWVAAGATVLGAKALHSMGERKGQQEVAGAFTQRIMEERAAQARMAALGPQQA